MRLTVHRHEPAARVPRTPWTQTFAMSASLAAMLLVVFELDRHTGSAPVQHLYYLPIILAAVRFGFRGGLTASLGAIVLYHAATPRLLAFRHEHWDVVQIALLLAVGLVTARLTDDRRRLHALATTDDLTGLHNLRSFETQLAGMVRTCRDARVPLAMLVLDLDRLKQLNDTHGHLAGAEAVRTVGRIIAARVGRDAVACRYGGDEFAIAVPCCSAADGRLLAEDLRQAVHETAPVLARVRFPPRTLAISVGVASRSFDGTAFPGEISEGEALFREADRALYRAKALGRNHVSTV
jgi:diguanylate cyclase (GGDEF)-like protein